MSTVRRGRRGVRQGRVVPVAIDPQDLARTPLSGGPLRIAAITFCRNEANYLPRWIGYYGEQFGREHLYVVDDNSDDGSTDGLDLNVVHVPEMRSGRFEETRMSVVSNLARALFELYDVVVFADTDEFVVPDPDRYRGLRDYIERQPADRLAVGALGVNVVHATGVESPLDPGQPLLGQRQLAKFLPLMCKPGIKWVRAPWAAGSHGLCAPYEVDRDLWLFHFKFADESLLRASADHRQAMVAADGRAKSTSWSKGGAVLVELVREITADITDIAAVPEFRPWRGEKLAELVIHDTPMRWRAPVGNQTKAMQWRPMVRIPERFHGIV